MSDLDLAIAVAKAKKAKAQSDERNAPQERGFGQALYDNIIGDPNDGVDSYGEQLGTWLNRGGETMTLGLVGDEASAAVTGMLPGRSYGEELDRYRGNEESMSGLGRFSADMVGSVVPALLGVGALGSMSSLGGRVAAGAGMGAGAGFTHGFMEGEDSFSDRLKSGGVGGLVGGALGGLMPVAAEAGRSGVRMVKDAMRNRSIGNAVGRDIGASPETSRVIANLIASDDGDAMRQTLQRSGPDAMLADASPQMRMTLDSAMRAPVPGASTARDRISTRAGNAYGDVMDALQPKQGPQPSVRSAMEAIRQGTKGARKSAYDAAYAKPIDYSSQAGSKLLDDITPRLPRQAVEYANRLMRVNGEKSAQIMANIADDGTVTFSRPPDVRQWDYIKQALDQLAESGDGAGALGGQTRMGAAYQGLAKDIRDAVAETVPEYKTALGTASDAISRRNSVKFGADMLRPQVTTDEALERIATATEPERAAMKEGLRGQLREVIGNVRAVASDQDIDARKAMDAYKRLSSDNAKLKMEALFGDDWPEIAKQLDRAGAALGLRAGLAANSATHGRGVAESMINEVIEPSALRRGQPLEAAKNVLGGITGASPEAIRALRDRTKSELADVLTRQGGLAERSLDSVAVALAKNPLSLRAGSNAALGIGLGGASAVPVATSQIIDLLSR